MSLTLTVADDLVPKMTEFVRAESLPWDLTAAGGNIEIVASAPEPQQCTPDVLRAGGWIVCSDAFASAELLGIPKRTMGKLLNHLDIKLKACQLGCF
ncbi:MAG: hypothetical protein JXO22_04070 [Phycisphaerae bacterium]|nr:hypothetical protein [Phycisphaerae bacterium]